MKTTKYIERIKIVNGLRTWLEGMYEKSFL